MERKIRNDGNDDDNGSNEQRALGENGKDKMKLKIDRKDLFGIEIFKTKLYSALVNGLTFGLVGGFGHSFYNIVSSGTSLTDVIPSRKLVIPYIIKCTAMCVLCTSTNQIVKEMRNISLLQEDFISSTAGVVTLAPFILFSYKSKNPLFRSVLINTVISICAMIGDKNTESLMRRKLIEKYRFELNEKLIKKKLSFDDNSLSNNNHEQKI